MREAHGVIALQMLKVEELSQRFAPSNWCHDSEDVRKVTESAKLKDS